MPYLPTNFGLLEEEHARYESSRVVVLPVPFERTTSYGKGTTGGPAAILRASQAMELYDEELGAEPYRMGIATLPPFLPEGFDMEGALAELEEEARGHLEAEKFLVVLGGEHSLTQAPVRAARAVHGEIGVVQFDAHADLREEFEGTPYSHASVMHQIVSDGVPTLAVGVRSLSAPEATLIRRRDLPVLWGHQLGEAEDLFPPLLATLPEKVYLTFDIDYFDPSLVPATGTPEPGGGLWYPTLALLRMLFLEKTVVAMDLVELAPIGGQPASDFLAAKLVYKCLGYLARFAASRLPEAATQVPS
jgi:agmatinase